MSHCGALGRDWTALMRRTSRPDPDVAHCTMCWTLTVNGLSHLYPQMYQVWTMLDRTVVVTLVVTHRFSVQSATRQPAPAPRRMSPPRPPRPPRQTGPSPVFSANELIQTVLAERALYTCCMYVPAHQHAQASCGSEQGTERCGGGGSGGGGGEHTGMAGEVV